VLYFYPKDDTPGCTIEACSFRDARNDLTDAGAQVVGISMDDTSSHDRFKARHNLGFTLLSDVTDEITKAYGAWGKNILGQEGLKRMTFIIDPSGIIKKTYSKVIPVNHAEKVLKDLKKLQNQ
jgi:thioredoxin-dependent peroxiredoxin